MFSSLDNAEKQMLANAMELVDIHSGDNLISQGTTHYTVLYSAVLCCTLLYSTLRIRTAYYQIN